MMVSCNNHQRILARQPRYGLRKLGVGVASVLLSTSFWLGMTSNVRADTNPTPAGTQANSGVGVPASDQQQPLTNAASNPAAAPAAATSTSKSLTPTRAIDDQVGQGITVTNHTITETAGDKDTGNPGTVTLHLGLTVPAVEVIQLQNGDYINVKLGLPYTTADGQQEVFSYGAINGNSQVPLWYEGHIVGYILPAGNLASYQQSVPGAGATVNDPHWQVVANSNDNALANAGSNGYYQIIFNSFLSSYFRNNQGTPNALTFNADLVWYNPSSNGDKKLLPPSQALVLYAPETSAGSYTPGADLQIGDQHYASGLHLQVVKDASTETIPVATKIVSSDHTGSVPAHTWVNGQEYLKLVDPTQGVGISLADVGSDFTITVTKPASTGEVETNFVSAADLQRELQEIIVPVISSDSIKLNDQLTDSGAFYLTKQYVYQKPLVKVERTDNGADEATYHVTVSGDYAGFRSTNSDGSSPVTLLTWKPTDPVALMPGDGIRNYKQDRQAASYGDQPGNWLGGYSIQSAAVREYMDSHPWHAKVVSQGQTKYDADWGYWIDIKNDLKPVSRAYVDSTYYGFVNQVIHFVNEQGQPMTQPSGEGIPDVKRQVIFTSKTGKAGSYHTDEQFNALNLPVVDGYTAYQGVQSADGQLAMTANGQAQTTGVAIRQAGQEAPFDFPHADFVEYVVYKPVAQENAHLRFYDDTDQRFIPGLADLSVSGRSDKPIVFTIPTNYDLSNYDYAGTYVGNDPANENQWLNGLVLSEVSFGNFDTAPADDQYFIAHFTHRTVPVSEQKTVTETIHYVDAAGHHLLPDYQSQVSFTQTGKRDLVTGAVTATWSGPQTFPAVTSPAISGYQPDIAEVVAFTVNHASSNVERTVVYRPVTAPVPTPRPEQPARPGEGGAQPGTRTGLPVAVAPAANNELAGSQQLPQTGRSENPGLIALGLAVLAASFGLAGTRRKNN